MDVLFPIFFLGESFPQKKCCFNSMNGTPLVILIDLDGTVQGDITPQIEEYKLLEKLHIKHNRKMLASDYTKGLLRPYFTNFVNLIDKVHSGRVELFVYTASEKVWAHHIVPTIESVTGVKFNRPIFTRNECNMDNQTHKSLAAVKPKIYRSLRKKYANITKDSLDHKIYLIDNSNVLQETKFLLKCPTYDYTVNIDMLRCIDADTRRKHHALISSHLGSNSCKSVWEMYKHVYQNAYDKYMMSSKDNAIQSKDRYWKQVCLIFRGFKDYRSILQNVRQLGRN